MADFDPHNINEGKDKDLDGIIRPQDLQDFTGQEKIVSNLKIFTAAAKMRGEALDHVLFHGPPGLGKTTLAHIIANELGVNMKVTSGPILDKPGDLAGLLTSLEEGDVLFIDEIHRLSPVVEEYLYSAMEDFVIDIMIDKPWSTFRAYFTQSVHAGRSYNTQRSAYFPSESPFRNHLRHGVLRYHDADRHREEKRQYIEGKHRSGCGV